jgi:hypothetical protein
MMLSVALGSKPGTFNIEERRHVECPGVFDFQWRPPVAADVTDSSPNACTALADGSCQLLHVSDDRIEPIASTAVASRWGGAPVSCDWDVYSSNLGIVASTSAGALVHCMMREGQLQVKCAWQGHTLEAWMMKCHPHMVRVLCM